MVIVDTGHFNLEGTVQCQSAEHCMKKGFLCSHIGIHQATIACLIECRNEYARPRKPVCVEVIVDDRDKEGNNRAVMAVP